MPTIETSIWLALRGHVETLTLDPVHPTAWPNEPFSPPEINGRPSEYLRVSHLPNSVSRNYYGSGDPQQFQGILQVSVMSKLDQASSVAMEHAGLVAAHFGTDEILSYGSVRLRILKRPDIGQGFRDEAAMLWMTPVNIQYQSFN